MGIFLDIIEQTTEKFGQFIDLTRSVNIKTPPVSFPGKSPELYECPLCGDVSLSFKERQRHIVDGHVNQHAYVKVDNKIIPDVYFVEGQLSNLEVVILGNQKGNIKIKVADDYYEEKNVSGAKSLMKYLHRFSNGIISISINVLSTSKEYILYCNEQPDFTNEEIDRAALKYLFVPLAERKEPNFSYFNVNFITKAPNKLEHRYAAGLHDYSLAFFMTHNKGNAKEYFESALSNLLIFKTNFAMTARRILALRMNSFKLLFKCQVNSRFYLANKFFNSKESKLKITTGSGINDEIGKKIDTTEYGVYIDDFTETFLNALNAYYNDDYNILDGLCDQLNNMISADDRNNQDKLFLLCARAAQNRGNISKAKEYYQNLVSNPLFNEEAQELLK